MTLDDHSERMIAEGCDYCGNTGVHCEEHEAYAVETMGCPCCFGASPLAAEVKRLREAVSLYQAQLGDALIKEES